MSSNSKIDKIYNNIKNYKIILNDTQKESNRKAISSAFYSILSRTGDKTKVKEEQDIMRNVIKSFIESTELLHNNYINNLSDDNIKKYITDILKLLKNPSSLKVFLTSKKTSYYNKIKNYLNNTIEYYNIFPDDDDIFNSLKTIYVQYFTNLLNLIDRLDANKFIILISHGYVYKNVLEIPEIEAIDQNILNNIIKVRDTKCLLPDDTNKRDRYLKLRAFRNYNYWLGWIPYILEIEDNDTFKFKNLLFKKNNDFILQDTTISTDILTSDVIKKQIDKFPGVELILAMEETEQIKASIKKIDPYYTDYSELSPFIWLDSVKNKDFERTICCDGKAIMDEIFQEFKEIKKSNSQLNILQDDDDSIKFYIPIHFIYEYIQKIVNLTQKLNYMKRLMPLIKENDITNIKWIPVYIFKKSICVSNGTNINIFLNKKDRAFLSLSWRDVNKYLLGYPSLTIDNIPNYTNDIILIDSLLKGITDENITPLQHITSTYTYEPDSDKSKLYNKIISIVDTYHDFKNYTGLIDYRNNILNRYIEEIITKISSYSSDFKTHIEKLLSRNTNIITQMVSMSIEKYLVNLLESTNDFEYLFESKLGNPNFAEIPITYEEYVSNPALIQNDRMSIVINLGILGNSEKSRNASGLFLEQEEKQYIIFKEIISKFFGNDSKFIIDRAELKREFFKNDIIYTGASLYDGNSPDRNGNFENINSSIEKIKGYLFSLDKIDINEKKVTFNDSTQSFNLNSDYWNKCKPNVGKKNEQIQKFMRDKQTCFQPVLDSINFKDNIIDLKRGGDVLQIISAYNLKDTYNIIFVTHDIIAATRARMLGLNVLYTLNTPSSNKILYCFKTIYNNEELLNKRFIEKYDRLQKIMNFIEQEKDKYSDLRTLNEYTAKINSINKMYIKTVNLLKKFLDVKFKDEIYIQILTCFLQELLYKSTYYENNYNFIKDLMGSIFIHTTTIDNWNKLKTLDDDGKKNNIGAIENAIRIFEQKLAKKNATDILTKEIFDSYLNTQTILEIISGIFIQDINIFHDNYFNKQLLYVIKLFPINQINKDVYINILNSLNTIDYNISEDDKEQNISVFTKLFIWLKDSYKNIFIKQKELDKKRKPIDDLYKLSRKFPKLKGGKLSSYEELLNKRSMIIDYYFNTDFNKYILYILYLLDRHDSSFNKFENKEIDFIYKKYSKSIDLSCVLKFDDNKTLIKNGKFCSLLYCLNNSYKNFAINDLQYIVPTSKTPASKLRTKRLTDEIEQ